MSVALSCNRNWHHASGLILKPTSLTFHQITFTMKKIRCLVKRITARYLLQVDLTLQARSRDWPDSGAAFIWRDTQWKRRDVEVTFRRWIGESAAVPFIDCFRHFVIIRGWKIEETAWVYRKVNVPSNVVAWNRKNHAILRLFSFRFSATARTAPVLSRTWQPQRPHKRQRHRALLKTPSPETSPELPSASEVRNFDTQLRNWGNTSTTPLPSH